MQAVFRPRFTIVVLTMCAVISPVCVPAQDNFGPSAGSPWNVNWGSTHYAEGRWTPLDNTSEPLELGGWLSAGFTANAHGNRSGNGNAPLPINNVSDGVVLNQLWLHVEKPLDLEAKCLDWGFRVDYVFGADAPDAQAGGDRGWDFGWNSSRDYGSAIPELYLQVGTGDLAVIAGYFIGLQGYEANQAVDNFFYSHNYGFGYGVPGTHSGVLATYQVTDCLEVDAGWTTGWDSWWSDYLNASTFIGGFTWTISDLAALTYHTTAGDFGDGTARNGARSNEGSIYAHAIVLTCDLTCRATYVLEHTLGNNTGLGNRDSQWYSITNYLFYDINDCWSAGARIEWFRDDDGQRVDVNGAGPGSFYEATLGLNWQPHPNLRIRPEVRWDWFAGQGRPFDSRDGGTTGTATSQFTGGLDIVATF